MTYLPHSLIAPNPAAIKQRKYVSTTEIDGTHYRKDSRLAIGLKSNSNISGGIGYSTAINIAPC
jgi:hypothetical protein